MPSALSISTLHVKLDSKILFSDFSLELTSGENAVIAGDSGSGKTTLLKCIMGFVVPERGEIALGGKKLDAHSVWELRSTMTLVQQEPDLGQGTVMQVLQRPFSYNINKSLTYNSDKTNSLLQRFRLSQDILDKEVRTLSGGEKQRVALVSALLLDRPLLLLDEITSALDKESKKAVIEYLKTLDQTTIIAVAHDEVIYEITDRVVELSKGAG
jgi:ABC-type multidrug transport system ATPase subunit